VRSGGAPSTAEKACTGRRVRRSARRPPRSAEGPTGSRVALEVQVEAYVQQAEAAQAWRRTVTSQEKVVGGREGGTECGR